MKKVITILLAFSMLFCLYSCKTTGGMDLKTEDIKDVVEIEMSVKDFGKIELELYHDIAPITVENFVSLVCDGFYDGTIFHRIVSGFMIQGGDDNGDGIGGSEKTIKGEFLANGVQNNISHKRGTISMARTSQSYDSASSQFFIMHADNTSLDNQYAAFGTVTKGLEVVDAIAAVETTYNAYGTEKSVPSREVKLEYVIVTDTYDRDENGQKNDDLKSVDELCKDPAIVEISVKGYGVMKLELYPDLAPITVKNFLSLANSGYYDGTNFHRIIKDFMIQGGAGDDSAETIKGEFSGNGVYNPLAHERGVISMARTNVPDSASSQFFIVHKDSPHLNGQYAAFGKVIEGIETVDSIANVTTDSNDAPTEEVIIEYVKVISERAEDVSETTEETTEVAELK